MRFPDGVAPGTTHAHPVSALQTASGCLVHGPCSRLCDAGAGAGADATTVGLARVVVGCWTTGGVAAFGIDTDDGVDGGNGDGIATGRSTTTTFSTVLTMTRGCMAGVGTAAIGGGACAGSTARGAAAAGGTGGCWAHPATKQQTTDTTNRHDMDAPTTTLKRRS